MPLLESISKSFINVDVNMADVFQLLGAPLPTTLLSCCDDEAWMNANALKPT